MSSVWNQSVKNRTRHTLTRVGILSAIVAASWAASWGTGFGFDAHARTPYSESEIRSVETSDEAKVRELSDQEVTQIRVTLGRRVPVNRMADLYFRLAEIQLESYRRTFLLEGRVHEKRLAAGQDDDTIDRSHSVPYLRAGLKACEEILKYKIPYSRMDQVIYFLGFYHGELGNRAQSEKYFGELVRQYPRSEFVGEAQRELGDLAFAAAEYRKAMAAYEGALRTGAGAAIRPRLLHKLAWTFYRTKQFDRAVKTMKEAIAGATESGEKFLSLKEEALKDMALFMTETGRVDEALEYFQSVAREKDFYPRMLEKLGRQYERNVETAKAVQVYESLLKTDPKSEGGFRVLVKLVELNLRRGKAREALERVRAYGPVPTRGEDETLNAAKNLRAMVRRTGTENHDLYRKKRDTKALAVSELAYTTYLEVFLANDDSRKETPEIRMYLAEVKRELGKAKEASALYRQVIESKDSRYAKEAGALWTASLADAIRKGGAGGGSEPTALEREFVEAADHLAENLSDTTEGREAALKAAQLLAGYSSTRKDGVKRVSKIVAQWPKSSQALVAARLWLQLSSENIETTGGSDAQDLIQDLRKNSALMASDQAAGGKLKSYMIDLESRVQVAAIAHDESDRDYKAAGRGYEAFAQSASSRDVAEKALANAVASYLKAEEGDEVERVSAAWLKRYPGSRRAVESLRSVATQRLIQGQYAASAQLFVKIGQEGQDPDSLDTAARIFDGIGERMQAQKTWVAAMTRYPNFSGRFIWGLQLGIAQERARLDSEAAKAFTYCQQAGGELEAECGARLGDLYLRAQDFAGARKAYERVAGLALQSKKKGKKSSSPIASPYVGYARYQLADLLERETHLEKIALPDAVLKKAVQQRLSFLEPLSRAYQGAVDAGGPWAIAALDRLALWATQFADDLDQVAAAPDLKNSLRSVSGPLRKKALDTWRDAHRKAQQSAVLSPALPGIIDRLSDQKLAEPARAQGPRGGFRLGGVSANGGNDGLSKALERVRERLTRSATDAVAWTDYGNLLWGENKPGLARLAYERALALNPKLALAWNNQGVVNLMTDGQEDWASALRANGAFQRALELDSFFLAAKINRAQLYNYYRLFVPALPLWQQVTAKTSEASALEGLSIALQGTGGRDAAVQASERARSADGVHSEFAVKFNEAARLALEPEGARKCLKSLDRLDEDGLQGFEKQSYTQLKKVCERWNNK